MSIAEMAASVEKMAQRRLALIAKAEDGIVKLTQHALDFDQSGDSDNARLARQHIEELRAAIAMLS